MQFPVDYDPMPNLDDYARMNLYQHPKPPPSSLSVLKNVDLQNSDIVRYYS